MVLIVNYQGSQSSGWLQLIMLDEQSPTRIPDAPVTPLSGCVRNDLPIHTQWPPHSVPAASTVVILILGMV